MFAELCELSIAVVLSYSCLMVRGLVLLSNPTSRLPLIFLRWAYVLQGVYFWAYGTPGVSIFGIFVAKRSDFWHNFRLT